ncbi:MAG TPA: hypothetical protein VJQ59_07655 [Candidatus Sulfotelmatobacter sp.]|nr:hypothetical protein [Candidatus Sulfotelmatobacter sp.]
MRFRILLVVFLAFCCTAFAQQETVPASSATPSDANPPASASSAAISAPDLTPGPDGKLSQQQMQELFRVVADKDLENQKRERDYTYVDREVQNKLDGSGNRKSTEERTYDVLQIAGEEVHRLTAKDDKPLDEKEAAKEDEKIQKIIDKRKNESDSDRRKREEKEEKDREDGRKFVKEIADAYNFTLVGTEMVNGRPAWVIDGEPRPGFEPHMKNAKFLTIFHGRVWIDQGDLQTARMDVEAIDTVSIGLFLARIHKGTRVMIEQTRVNDEVWLPKHLTFKLDARVALLKGYKMDGEDIYSDYKKFRTSSKIVGMGELPEDKDSSKQK